MNSTVDFDRYDRQNRTYGKKATQQLSNSTIIIIGLAGGLATESCKNLLLSGVQDINLVEDSFVTSSDIDSGFYYQESDIGMERHVVLAKKLAELNPYCQITSSKFGEVDWTNKVVIQHNSTLAQAIIINKLCRENNSKFVWTRTQGFAGSVFVDCLENHIVNDLSGEIVEPVQLENISFEGKVSCAQHNSHDFETGDIIKFSNLSGDKLDILAGEWKIKVINKMIFQLENFTPVKDFKLVNGTVVLVKQSVNISHKSLEDQIVNPTLVGFNEEFDSEVLKFLNDSMLVPQHPWSSEMEEYVGKINNKQIRKLTRAYHIELMPVVSVLGSLAAMEVIKLVTCKFTPINQWMIYSDTEIVPDSKPNDVNVTSVGLESLLGSEFKTKMESTDWLMVGCGAIGCEVLKNMSKLNIATNGGSLSITDPDHIEHSNTSRQFLFRNQHIGKSKSKTACSVINDINSNICINAMEDKMSSENQELIDNMAPKLFGVINALDNIEARRYMDEQCFRYGKPLFESGTQGMKGNTQPVIPFVTETYSNSSDPAQEKSFPVCTIKNFPNQPLHTIHWAMDYFDQFNRGPENVKKYSQELDTFLDSLSGYDKSVASEDIYNYLVKYNPESWRDCAKWASDMFLELYRDQIIQLLHNFPQDSYNSTGELFWSKGKRCPNIVEYDLTNDTVVDFLESTTHLLTKTCSLDDSFSREELIAELVSYIPYEFTIDESKKIASNDEELKDEEQTIVKRELPTKDIKGIKKGEIFEKDDDSNWHVSFITAASNLRSLNYGIPISTFDETKGIAGKIVPAVVTTTSIVAGLISMEIIKYCSFHGKNSWYERENILESYKSWFVNLSTNILIASEPISAPMLKFGETKINSWTKFELTEDMTLEKFIELYETKFNTTIGMVLNGSSIIFANFMPSDNGNKSLTTIYQEKYNIDLYSTPVEIVIASDDDGIDLPTIQIKLERNSSISL